MDSWSYVSEEKGYVNVSNDAISPTNGRTKGSFLGWELKTPCGFSIEDQGFDELGFPGGISLGKQLSNDDDDPIRVTTTSPAAAASVPNVFLSSFGGSNRCCDSLIDLKLGRVSADHGDASRRGTVFSKGAAPPVVSSPESSTPLKRVRASGVQTQAAYCQVYGCNKDLSGCKDYHKRHKVCEVHSKTSKVIVNGIEQRFCQQCSRFHLLAEFDDGKRSCRKRLAGHNERRRKPQVGIHSGKPGKLLQPYGESRFQGTMLTSASFICQEILPGSVLSSERYGTNDWWRPIKSEDGADFRHLSSIPVTNGNQSRSLFPSYNEKQFPFLHGNVATSAAVTGSIFCENNSQYHPHALGGPNSGSPSLFQDTSLASEDFNVFDTESTVQRLSGISDSGCALSLLSSQSNSSSQSSGIPMARPLVIPHSHSHYSMSQVSEKMMGISSQTSSGVSDRFPSELNHADGSHLSPVLLSDNNEIINFEMADGIFPGSDFGNVKDRLSSEDGLTIDLLQLSSQLQRVERQRQSLQVKQENDSSCSLRIT